MIHTILHVLAFIGLVVLLCWTFWGLFTRDNVARARRQAGWSKQDWKDLQNKTFRKPLQQYGYDLIGDDKYGKLWNLRQDRFLRLMEAAWLRGSSNYHNSRYWELRSYARMVEVKDPSTGKDYFLRVPSGHRGWGFDTSTPKAAVAWTFNMTADEYNPEVET